jgi:hypothetical protein
VLRLRDRFFSQIALDNHRERKEAFPSLDHFMIAPPGSKLGIDMKNNVIMVMQNGIRTDIYSKNINKLLHAIDDPLASMFIAFAGIGVHTAEKGAADTARDAVVIGRLFQKNQCFPRLGHRITP